MKYILNLIVILHSYLHLFYEIYTDYSQTIVYDDNCLEDTVSPIAAKSITLVLICSTSLNLLMACPRAWRALSKFRRTFLKILACLLKFSACHFKCSTCLFNFSACLSIFRSAFLKYLECLRSPFFSYSMKFLRY